MTISTPMKPIDKDTSRLSIETFDAVVGRTEPDGYTNGHDGYPVSISIAREGKDGQGPIHEVVFQWTGNQSAYMKELLRDLSIAVSRAMQRRDAMTGEAIAD
jgi:hypothetical protein